MYLVWFFIFLAHSFFYMRIFYPYFCFIINDVLVLVLCFIWQEFPFYFFQLLQVFCCLEDFSFNTHVVCFIITSVGIPIYVRLQNIVNLFYNVCCLGYYYQYTHFIFILGYCDCEPPYFVYSFVNLFLVFFFVQSCTYLQT